MKRTGQIILSASGLLALLFFAWVGLKTFSPQTLAQALTSWRVGYGLMGGFVFLFVAGASCLLMARQRGLKPGAESSQLSPPQRQLDPAPSEVDASAGALPDHDIDHGAEASPVSAEREVAVDVADGTEDHASSLEAHQEAGVPAVAEVPEAVAETAESQSPSSDSNSRAAGAEAAASVPASSGVEPQPNASEEDVSEREASIASTTANDQGATSHELLSTSEGAESYQESGAVTDAQAEGQKGDVHEARSAGAEDAGQEQPSSSGFPDSAALLQSSLQEKLANFQKQLVDTRGEKPVLFGGGGSDGAAFDIPTRRVGAAEVEVIEQLRDDVQVDGELFKARGPQNVTRPVPGFAKPELKQVEPVDPVPATVHGQPREPFGDPIGDITATTLNTLWQEYVEANHTCGRETNRLKPATFAAHLKQNHKKILERFQCDSVRFAIKIKAGKVSLQAVPIKRRVK